MYRKCLHLLARVCGITFKRNKEKLHYVCLLIADQCKVMGPLSLDENGISVTCRHELIFSNHDSNLDDKMTGRELRLDNALTLTQPLLT